MSGAKFRPMQSKQKLDIHLGDTDRALRKIKNATILQYFTCVLWGMSMEAWRQYFPLSCIESKIVSHGYYFTESPVKFSHHDPRVHPCGGRWTYIKKQNLSAIFKLVGFNLFKTLG